MLAVSLPKITRALTGFNFEVKRGALVGIQPTATAGPPGK